MSGESQLFRIDPQNRQPDRIEEVDFRWLGISRKKRHPGMGGSQSRDPVRRSVDSR